MYRFMLALFFLPILFGSFEAGGRVLIHPNFNSNSNVSARNGIKLPDHMSFNSSPDLDLDSGSDCGPSISNTQYIPTKPSAVRFQLKHRFDEHGQAKELLLNSTARDLIRIQTLHTRIIAQKKNQNTLVSRLEKPNHDQESISGQMTATLESGVSLGSGEYFMDVFIGTPPKHFSLILDTGSDLNWIQCLPCYDCFQQNGPHYAPLDSSSFQNINCNDPRCQLVSSPDPPQPCHDNNNNNNQTCSYFYWYGDSSNTTGDFALETFTVNLTSPSGKPDFRQVKDVMFGCGHWNRGLFHGAAGLLGLGRGPLSFSSQIQNLYGHSSFSYCLVDRNSNVSVTSRLIFGEDQKLLSHPQLNFTSFVKQNNQNMVDTFYYVQIKAIVVGGQVLKIPKETWSLSEQGTGGTIIDSGTTLSYFADPAYKIIKDAFIEKVKTYPIVQDFPMLSPCYNVSGWVKPELPTFGIVFGDGVTWNFPVENYFIRLEPEDIMCMAILGTPKSSLSIIGNYQQQNFHVLYDTNKSRLGFAPANCADV